MKSINKAAKYISNNMELEFEIIEIDKDKIVSVDVFCPSGMNTPGTDNPGITWVEFHHINSTISNKTERSNKYGIIYNTSNDRFHYLAGTSVTNFSDVLERLTPLTFSKGLYFICRNESSDFKTAVCDNLNTANDFTHKWIKESEYTTTRNSWRKSINQKHSRNHMS